jgi:hypothetical protein
LQLFEEMDGIDQQKIHLDAMLDKIANHFR